ncbi:hypothetical protein K493DRAFT_344193 [Basidiobolus meristosporus CBS 931.73]|uniref:Uncharacterized protein n=1 Tax=Basidiobolus meristosporus CBS 931.73 TaxID=1314790 RepID=A0A1Y1ZA96_9FUNG|nr:hypothetical protein K493DRAFT_344193 [Basidiobolus meristosporus CBS 931.73]|eukprot:ORY07086.1 hypothetical protein K493DRAFT_344193 [Basidiobolus meristosporus CBS 931.73]
MKALRKAISRRLNRVEVAFPNLEKETQGTVDEVAEVISNEPSIATEASENILKTPTTPSFSNGNADTPGIKRNPRILELNLRRSSHGIHKLGVKELQDEEDTIVKKIEKLNEDKHTLFLRFKRMISDRNHIGRKEVIRESQDKSVNLGIKAHQLTSTHLCGNDTPIRHVKALCVLTNT